MASFSKKEFFSKLHWIFEKDTLDSIYNLKIPAEISTTLIYNTNDLCLNKEQFDALMNVIAPDETIYVIQNDSDEIYQFHLPMSYDEYQSLNFFSITFLASDKFDWVCVIEEDLESGIGFLVAPPDMIQKYHSQYQKGLSDMQDLISFFFRDFSRNPYAMQNLLSVLSLWHK